MNEEVFPMKNSHPTLTLTTDGDRTVVRFNGSRLCLDESAAIPLGEELVDLADGPAQGALVVDLGNVEFLSSTMLGVLIRMQRTLSAAGRRLVVGNVRPVVYEVFEATRLTTYLDVRRDLPGTAAGEPARP
jgi:anti-anti-sigma factor